MPYQRALASPWFRTRVTGLLLYRLSYRASSVCSCFWWFSLHRVHTGLYWSYLDHANKNDFFLSFSFISFFLHFSDFLPSLVPWIKRLYFLIFASPINCFANKDEFFLSFSFISFFSHFSEFVPSLVPWINRLYFLIFASLPKERIDIGHKVFNFDCLFKQHVTEWAIPR